MAKEKEIYYKNLDANPVDALKRYEQQFVYDEELYTTRMYSYYDHVNSMAPKFDTDYVMTNDPNKQIVAEYGNDTTFTEYYGYYFEQATLNRVPYNTILDTISFKDILDIIPLSNYRKNDRIYKVLNKPILKYLIPGQKLSFKDELRKVIDFLIEEEIIVVKDFTEDFYASVRNRFVSLLQENNIISKYYLGWSSFFVIGPIGSIPSNKKYQLKMSNASFLPTWQSPIVYYEMFTVTEDVIYNTGLPGNDVLITTSQNLEGFYTMVYGKQMLMMKNMDHIDTGNQDSSPFVIFKMELKQYT